MTLALKEIIKNMKTSNITFCTEEEFPILTVENQI